MHVVLQSARAAAFFHPPLRVVRRIGTPWSDWKIKRSSLGVNCCTFPNYPPPWSYVVRITSGVASTRRMVQLN